MYVSCIYRTMETIISGSGASIACLEDNEDGFNAEDKELDVIDTDEINELSEMKHKDNMNDHDVNENDENDEGKKKTPVWRKQQKKKQTKKQGWLFNHKRPDPKLAS